MHRVFSSNANWKLWLRVAVFVLCAVWGFAGVIALPLNCDAGAILTGRSSTECPGQVSSFFIELSKARKLKVPD
jgi:hypothetical protein